MRREGRAGVRVAGGGVGSGFPNYGIS